MKRVSEFVASQLVQISPRFLPFADAASPDLPLPRLLRLSLFQVSVGMAGVLVIGTLKRGVIGELGGPAWLGAGVGSPPPVEAPGRGGVGAPAGPQQRL